MAPTVRWTFILYSGGVVCTKSDWKTKPVWLWSFYIKSADVHFVIGIKTYVDVVVVWVVEVVVLQKIC